MTVQLKSAHLFDPFKRNIFVPDIKMNMYGLSIEAKKYIGQKFKNISIHMIVLDLPLPTPFE